MLEVLIAIISKTWALLGQMSPYLLFGFAAAGLLSVVISAKWVERHLGRKGFGPIFKASLFGVPLPLCSCSVLPVAVSMRKNGASRAATTSFLLSTPQTGIDSIAVTYAMLGPIFTIFRPIAALITGLIGGVLVQIGDKDTESPLESQPAPASCCSTEKPAKWSLKAALHHGFIVLPRDLRFALLAGVLIAGIMAALVPQDYLGTYIGGGLLSILLMMIAGVPVYVCATASVPIAAGLIHMGASPGAALAFLIAGPATNIAAIPTIWKSLGKRSALTYLFTVGLSAVACGLAMDWLMPLAGAALPDLTGHIHGSEDGGWMNHAWAIALLAVLAYSSIKQSAPSTEPTANPTPALETLPSGGSCCCSAPKQTTQPE